MSSSKKNKFVKILLPIVILIWGYVGYVIFDAFSSDDTKIQKTPVESNYSKPTIEKKESFELIPIDSDPFLGTLYKKPKVNRTASANKSSKKEIKWPSIQFQGIVSGGASSVYMVSINGQQHLLSKGDEIQKVKLIKGSSENVSLQFEGQTKQFPIM
jgi:hypothetical protein